MQFSPLRTGERYSLPQTPVRMLPGQGYPETPSSRNLSPIRGESRFEYVPIQRSYIEYEEQEIITYVPRERRVIDYYAVEYITEYVQYTIQEKVVEYVAVDRYQERIEYTPIERQIVHYPAEVQNLQFSPQRATSTVAFPQAQEPPKVPQTWIESRVQPTIDRAYTVPIERE